MSFDKKAYFRKYYLNRGKVENARIFRDWYKKNTERGREITKNARLKMRKIILEKYGGPIPKCACCSEKTFKFLTIDHKNNDGATERKRIGGIAFLYDLRKRGFPEGYQILCYNCNCGKALNNGVCPHKDYL